MERVRHELKSSEARCAEMRAAELEKEAEVTMAGTVETGLRAALAAAEREVSATRERGEARLVEIEAQHDAEAKGHLERAALWQQKLDAFLEAMHAGRGMDLRAFVTNDPIHKALVAGVEREEANGRDFLARQKAGSADLSSA